MDTMSAEVDAVHTEAADAAVLVVSELVTNALRYGGGKVRMAAARCCPDAREEGPRPAFPQVGGPLGEWSLGESNS